jgi:hypothetical protein
MLDLGLDFASCRANTVSSAGGGTGDFIARTVNRLSDAKASFPRPIMCHLAHRVRQSTDVSPQRGEVRDKVFTNGFRVRAHDCLLRPMTRVSVANRTIPTIAASSRHLGLLACETIDLNQN